MWNIRGLDSSAASTLCWKLPYLEELVTESVESYSIISITETWFKPHLTDAQLDMNGYNIFRSDRIKRGRGGCCLYIKDSITVTDHYKYDDDHIQVVCCSLDQIKTLVFAVYRPGDTPHQKFYNAVKFVQSYMDTKDDTWNFIMTGDFNFPNIRWDTLDVKPGSSACKICAETLLQFMESNMLLQVIDKPTRIANSGTENMLELVITNNSDLFKEVEALSSSLSDHEMVTVILSNELQGATPPRHIDQFKKRDNTIKSFNALNFHKANFDEIRRDLQSINWTKLKSDCADNDFPMLFYETVLSICYLHTPVKSLSKVSKSKYHKVCYSINRKRRKIKARLKAVMNLNPQSRIIESLKAKLIKLEKEAQQKILYVKDMKKKRHLEL